jgi:hypothetical protein
VTVAEHWLVWLVWTLVGVQETLTDVIVGDTGGVLQPPPPPPQPANSDERTTMKASRTDRLEVSLSPQFRIKLSMTDLPRFVPLERVKSSGFAAQPLGGGLCKIMKPDSAQKSLVR